MRKTYKLLLALFLTCWVGVAWAQNRSISGKVTDSGDGSPLPGVSVAIKGTTTGATTGADGKYTLASVPDNATLVFSFIGFTTEEIAIGNRTTIDVRMISDIKSLQEVVVTAIGIERDKKALGYAVSSVKGDALQQRSEPDPLRALNGKVPGVNITAGGGAPGQATKINIRGNSSLTGNTQPLFIVDGIPFDNSTNGGGAGDFASNTSISNRAYDIDPNNIESMTVLKGAAAAALYGSRATNGVVVITTKSGSKGKKKGLEVTYNTSYSQETVSSIPDYQNKYTQGSNQNYNGGFIGNWGAAMPNYVDELNAQLGVNYYSKTYGLYRNTALNRAAGIVGTPYPEGTAENPLRINNSNFCALYPELCDQNDNGLPYAITSHDIVGGFFRKGHVIENAINLSSTGDKTSINAGVSRMTNQGIVDNMKSARTTLNFGGNALLANGLTLSGSVQYINTAQETPPTGAGFYTDYGGFGNEGSIYGRIYYLPRNFDLNGLPFENPITGANLFYRSGLDNPRWAVKYNTYTSDVNRAIGNMALSYNITPWLNVLLKGGVNTYAERRQRTVRKGGTAIPLGTIVNTDINYTEQDYNFIVTFDKTFGESFAVKALVGANANERSRKRQDVQGTDIIQPGLGYTATQIASPQFKSLRRLLGLYTDLSLSYKNTYFLGFVARNDYASTLPKNNRSYFYPGVNTSVVFTDALNLNSKVLTYGKLRAAYTKVGREADPYQLYTTYGLGQAYRNYQGLTFFNASLSDILNNPNLKPESTVEFEVGTELQFFQNRVNLDLTYFNRNSFDQIVTRRIPSSTGFSNQVINSGEIRNRGWELGLNVVPVKLANGFEWNSYFAYTRLRSLIVDDGVGGRVNEDGSVTGGIFLGGTGLSSLGTLHVTGQPYGVIYGTKNARDAAGNLLINEGTGLPISLPTSRILGNPLPDFTLGWTNTFTWKGITLSALIDWRQGGKMFSSTAASLLLRGQLKVSENNREGTRVVPGVYGDPGTYEPILDDNGQTIRNTTPVTAFDYHFTDGFGAYGADEVNVYDVTTIRLREVTLGYSLPKSLLEKTPFGSVRVSLSGRNLWFKAPNMLKGLNFDPEILGTFPDLNVQGFDLGATPSTRRYGVNVSLTF